MQTIIETIKHQRERAYERHQSVEFQRLWQDETTWVAETLDAPLEKDRLYNYRKDDLYSPEGDGLTQIFETSIDYYCTLAEGDPSLKFQYRRSIVEAAELDAMLRMARGAGGNTLVVVSTYPDELKNADRDILGYNHKRKMGFIRIIKRMQDNQLQMWTHSFDRNDADGINAMYERLGRQVDWSRDVLEQTTALDLTTEEMEQLGDQLLYAYDKAMHEKDGGNYYAGRSEEDRRNSIQFVESQRDLVTHHVRQVLRHGRKPGFLSEQRYDFAIAMRRRHEGKQVIASDIAGEMSTAGVAGRAAGEIASGCGLTVSAEANTSDALNEAGYKVVDYRKEMYEGEKRIDDCMQCPACKKRGVMIEKLKDKIHYTCQSSGCNATTKTNKETEKQSEKVIVAPRTRLANDSSPKTDVVKEHGEYAELRDLMVVGGIKKVIVDRRTGFELAA